MTHTQNYQVAVINLDDLWDKAGNLPSETMQMLGNARKAGNDLVLSSGRIWSGFEYEARQLDLLYMPSVSSGALLRKKTADEQDVIAYKPVIQKYAFALKDYAKGQNANKKMMTALFFMFDPKTNHEIILAQEPINIVGNYDRKTYSRLTDTDVEVDEIELKNGRQVSQIMLLSDQEKWINIFQNEIKANGYQIKLKTGKLGDGELFYVSITSDNDLLTAVAKYLNIPKKEIWFEKRKILPTGWKGRQSTVDLEAVVKQNQYPMIEGHA
ncbi:MAG: HAD hydrolase family protein [Nanoarchaeota archaeon]